MRPTAELDDLQHYKHFNLLENDGGEGIFQSQSQQST